MKKLLFIIVTSLIFFASCKKNDSVTNGICTIENPLENIQWLKDIHFTFQAAANPLPTKIVQYVYQGECVFLIDECVNCTNGVQTVYNEAQEVICEFGIFSGLNTCTDFFDEATDEVILWGD